MAKKANVGKCVHCLQDNIELTSDHMFPKSWYPDATPKDLEKWQIPSCLECNHQYGELENDLLGRIALTLDPKNPASAGLAEKALRAINPDAAKNEGDAAAREARARKILGDMFKGDQIDPASMVPGLGERWGRSQGQQLAIRIPEKSLPAITEKIVRGLAYREDNAFIEPPYKVDCYLVEDSGATEAKAALDRAGKVFKREPGLEIRRAIVDGDQHSALYEITFWQQLRTYATVSKLGARELPNLFRVVRHTNNADGILAERAVLAGRLETREAAVAYVEAQAAKNTPWGFDPDKACWWITDRNGRVHWLLIEG